MRLKFARPFEYDGDWIREKERQGTLSLMTLNEQIAVVPLFRGLRPEQCQTLANIAIERTYAKGQNIFVEGADAAGFYVLVSGRVKVYKLSPEGKEQILHVIEPHDAFGEAAVFAGHRFPAHADAMEASKTLFFPRHAFLAIVERHPSLALNMLAYLSRRLHRFANLIESLSLKEVPGRLAAHLLYLSERQDDRDELLLDLSKVQLASLLGTIPETLSRVLAKMAREGLIEVQEGRHIRLLDRESLEELATGERRLGAGM